MAPPLIHPSWALVLAFGSSIIGLLISYFSDLPLPTIFGCVVVIIILPGVSDLLPDTSKQSKFYFPVWMVVLATGLAVACSCMHMVEAAIYACNPLPTDQFPPQGYEALWRCDSQDIRTTGMVGSMVWFSAAFFLSHVALRDDESLRSRIAEVNDEKTPEVSPDAITVTQLS